MSPLSFTFSAEWGKKCFYATQLVSCPFWRLELKALDGPIESRPMERSPNKSATKGFPCHQRRSDDLEESLWYQLPLQRLPLFNWDPTILFFFFFVPLFPSLFTQREAGAKRGIIIIIFFFFIRLFGFRVYSLPSATVTHLTKLYKRIRQFGALQFPPTSGSSRSRSET